MKCFDCGALIPVDMGECPACNSTALADRIEAETEINRQQEARQQKNLDTFRLNEKYMKTLDRSRKQVELMQKEFGRRLERREAMTVKELCELERYALQISRDLGNLATAQARVAREQLQQQVHRSKIVTEMTLEQQFAYLLEWARKLAAPYRTMFIEQLKALDEKMTIERAQKRAAKRHATQKAIEG